MNRSVVIMLAVVVMLMVITSLPNHVWPKSREVVEAEQRLCEARKRLNVVIDKCEAQHGKGACSVEREDLSVCKQ